MVLNTGSSYFRFGCKTGVEISQTHSTCLKNSVLWHMHFRRVMGASRILSARPWRWPWIRKQFSFWQNRVMTVSLGKTSLTSSTGFSCALRPYGIALKISYALRFFFCWLFSWVVQGDLDEEHHCRLSFLAYAGIERFSSKPVQCIIFVTQQISLNFEPKMFLWQLKESIPWIFVDFVDL